jgi:hypothetical protein
MSDIELVAKGNYNYIDSHINHEAPPGIEVHFLLDDVVWVPPAGYGADTPYKIEHPQGTVRGKITRVDLRFGICRGTLEEVIRTDA